MDSMKNKTKKCTQCSKVLTLDQFHKRKAAKDGLRSDCKVCHRASTMQHYYKNREGYLAHKRNYDRTRRGKALSAYRNAKGRVGGSKIRSAIARGGPLGSLPRYVGLPIMDRDSFIEWALNDEWYNKLFDEWAASGYELVDSPSLDRLDTRGGYILGNIFWSTHSENSRAGSLSRWR